jgi:squalene-hopene cyclase-like protein
MVRRLSRPIHRVRRFLSLSALGRDLHRKDRAGLPLHDPAIEKVVDEAVAWLGRAQDHSLFRDGGIARHFSLIDGWGSSYPETTGYIVPTLLAYADLRGETTVRPRVQQILDWLVSIQLPDGSFQGGAINATPVVPVTFNTGQILIGLASGVREFGSKYREPMLRAADWLVQTQDSDGCWRRFPTPFAELGEKAYETHVAWGLLEAARLEPAKPYADSALANVRWALTRQQQNGWFSQCCLTDATQPLTHTLGYALRGLVEAYRYTNDSTLLRACCRTADGLLTAMREDGFLPGRLDSKWQAAVRWACLTGSVQIAICWLLLYRFTGELKYLSAAFQVNRYVRRTVSLDGPPEIRGAVKGSFPIDGAYGAYQYPNWACKFLIDSNLEELAIRREQCCAQPVA